MECVDFGEVIVHCNLGTFIVPPRLAIVPSKLALHSGLSSS